MGTFGGTHLTESQIYQYAVDAGFPAGQWAEYATATAMTESGGWTGAISDTGATGLWQIIHGHWPRGMTQAQAEDAATNAKMAYALFTGRGGTNVSASQAFADWWPYDGGPSNKNWGKYLTAAQQAATGKGGAEAAGAAAAGDLSGAGGGLGGATNGLGGDVVDVQPIIDAITGMFPNTNEATGEVKTDVGGKIGQAAAAAVGIAKGVSNWLGGLVDDLDKMLKAVLWLVNPANEIRLLMAVFGTIFFGVGAFLIVREAKNG